MPGARTPSSLLIRMRYGGGCGRVCCALAGDSSCPTRQRASSEMTARALGMAPRVSERGGWTPDHPVDRPGQDAEQNHGDERCEQSQDTGDERADECHHPDEHDDWSHQQTEQAADEPEYETEHTAKQEEEQTKREKQQLEQQADDHERNCDDAKEQESQSAEE